MLSKVSRVGAVLFSVAALSATSFVMIASPAGAAGPEDSEDGETKGAWPIGQCSWPLGDDEWVSVFGYGADEDTKYNVGSKNQFTPPPKDRGQGTEFEEGTTMNHVVVRHTGKIRWHLGADDADAPFDKQCESNPMPSTGNPWSIVVWGALLLAGSGFATRRARTLRRGI